MIEDKSATWKDFISDESKYMLVKSYMHLKVKLLFDPPLSSAVLECYKNTNQRVRMAVKCCCGKR